MRSISSDQERAQSSLNTAADSALDRVVANAVIMLGICITTGFTTWTAKQLLDNSSTQIGSLALLASVLVGLSAMFTSALQLSTVNKAFHQILSLKELKINRRRSSTSSAASTETKWSDFLTPRWVSAWDLFRASSWSAMPLAAIFGPAFPLLPSGDEDARRPRTAAFEHHVNVRGQDVVFTTSLTSRHRRDLHTNENIDSINVCCKFKYMLIATATKSEHNHRPPV